VRSPFCREDAMYLKRVRLRIVFFNLILHINKKLVTSLQHRMFPVTSSKRLLYREHSIRYADPSVKIPGHVQK